MKTPHKVLPVKLTVFEEMWWVVVAVNYPFTRLDSLKIALPWGMKELFSKGRHKLKSKIVLTIDLFDISIDIFRIY